MKFLPTSSLDVINTPTPFVRATEWGQFRSQFRSRKSQKNGYRNSLAASEALNPGSLSWDCPGMSPQVNMASRPFEIVLQSEPDVLESTAVDECFALESIDRLLGEDGLTEISRIAPRRCVINGEDQQNSPSMCSESTTDNLDLELGLLESVQELAVSLARMSPTRPEASVPS